MFKIFAVLAVQRSDSLVQFTGALDLASSWHALLECFRAVSGSSWCLSPSDPLFFSTAITFWIICMSSGLSLETSKFRKSLSPDHLLQGREGLLLVNEYYSTYLMGIIFPCFFPHSELLEGRILLFILAYHYPLKSFFKCIK